MAANRGHQYEVNAARVLKKFKLMPQNAKPAGSMSNKPDITIWYNGMKEGVELKTEGASAGSVKIVYDGSDSKPWKFKSDSEGDSKEKAFLIDLADEEGILTKLPNYWKEVPYLRESMDAKWKSTAGKKTILQRYNRDKKMFPDLLFSADSSAIEDYYIAKDIHYINIGIYGFYTLGNLNPLNLQGLPRFGDVADTEFRVRCQKKNEKGYYQFTCELQFTIAAKNRSPYNIAPIRGNTVDIVMSKMDLSCFDKL